MAISSKRLATACTIFSLAFASAAVPQALAAEKPAPASATVGQNQAQASTISYVEVLLHPGMKYTWGPENAENASKFSLVDDTSLPAGIDFGISSEDGMITARPTDDAPQNTQLHRDILVTFKDGSNKVVRAKFVVQEPHIRHDIKPAGDPVKDISSLIDKDDTKTKEAPGNWEEIGKIIGIVVSVISVLVAGGVFLANLGQLLPKP